MSERKKDLEYYLRQFASDTIECFNLGLEGYNYRSTRGYENIKKFISTIPEIIYITKELVKIRDILEECKDIPIKMKSIQAINKLIGEINGDYD